MPDTRPRLDFVVVGAQKSATSWLYLCLRDHPGIHLPPVKREREYVGSAEYRRRGADWFFEQVGTPGAGQVVGDVSVEYLVDPCAPQHVAALAPSARAVALVRHPVDRALSAHGWLLRRGDIDERDAADALRRALDDEAAGRDTVHTGLLTTGDYDVQLARWVEALGAAHVYVDRFDRVASNPTSVLEGIYGFLEVDQAFEPPSRTERPKQNARSRLLVAAERLAPRSRLVRYATNRLNQLAARVAGPAPPPDLPADLRAALDARFAPHVAGLDRLVRQLPAANRPAQTFEDAWPR
ncbi:sulfotransferase domain-containing protein [Rubrivirga sp. IMCC45206]|uniref:sulfotransferase domain-containing protein n=1 Tax=Rubrivirga sp. IMCC45206 TaxID=3391614 RepID=UPI00398FE4F9